MTRCPDCGQPRPTPTVPHVVDGVLVEPVPLGVEGVTVWRAVGRPDLPLCSYPPTAAALAKAPRVEAAPTAPEQRPLANLEDMQP